MPAIAAAVAVRSMTMPVHVFWDDEACSILRISVSGHWTWEDLAQAKLILHALCEESPHRVDVLNDLRDMTYRPPRMGEMARMGGSLAQPANVGMVAFVVNDFTYALFRPLIKHQDHEVEHVFVSTLHEARQMIAQARAGYAMPAFLPHDGQLN
jgi:hypothetical protein